MLGRDRAERKLCPKGSADGAFGHRRSASARSAHWFVRKTGYSFVLGLFCSQSPGTRPSITHDYGCGGKRQRHSVSNICIRPHQFRLFRSPPSSKADNPPGRGQGPSPNALSVRERIVPSATGACSTWDPWRRTRLLRLLRHLRLLRQLRHGRHRRRVCRTSRKCRNGVGPDFGKRRVRIKPHRRPPR